MNGSMPLRDDLLEAATRLRPALIEKRFGKPFAPEQVGSDSARIEETETGGYWVSVATIGEDRPDIEIWLDRYVDGKNPVYWAGFGATSRTKITKLVTDSGHVFGLLRRKG